MIGQSGYLLLSPVRAMASVIWVHPSQPTPILYSASRHVCVFYCFVLGIESRNSQSTDRPLDDVDSPLPLAPVPLLRIVRGTYRFIPLGRVCGVTGIVRSSISSSPSPHGYRQRRGPMLRPLLAEAEASQGEEAPQQVHAKLWRV